MPLVEEMFYKAERLSQLRKWDEAIELLRKCLSVDSHNLLIHHRLVSCLAIRGLYSQIIQEFMRCIEALFMVNRFNEIKPLIEKVLNVSSEKEKTLKMLIKLYNTGEDPQGLYNLTLMLARLYLNEDKQARAFKLIEKVADSKPEDRHVRRDIAQLFARMEKWEECVLTFKEVIEEIIQDDSPEEMTETVVMMIKTLKNELIVNLILAEAYETLRQTAIAMEYYEKILAIDPENRKALLGKGSVYVLKEEYAQAVESLEVLYELNPDDFDVLLGMADACAHLGNKKKSVRYLKHIASLLLMDQNYDDACRIYEAILTVDCDNAQAQREYDRLKKKMVFIKESVPEETGPQAPPVQQSPLPPEPPPEPEVPEPEMEPPGPGMGLLEQISYEEKREEMRKKAALLKKMRERSSGKARSDAREKAEAARAAEEKKAPAKALWTFPRKPFWEDEAVNGAKKAPRAAPSPAVKVEKQKEVPSVAPTPVKPSSPSKEEKREAVPLALPVFLEGEDFEEQVPDDIFIEDLLEEYGGKKGAQEGSEGSDSLQSLLDALPFALSGDPKTGVVEPGSDGLLDSPALQAPFEPPRRAPEKPPVAPEPLRPKEEKHRAPAIPHKPLGYGMPIEKFRKNEAPVAKDVSPIETGVPGHLPLPPQKSGRISRYTGFDSRIDDKLPGMGAGFQDFPSLPFKLSGEQEVDSFKGRKEMSSPTLQVPFDPPKLPDKSEQFTAEASEILDMLESSLNVYESKWFLGIFTIGGQLLWYGKTQGIPSDVALQLQTFPGLFDDFHLMKTRKMSVFILEFRNRVYQFYFLAPRHYMLLVVYNAMNFSALHVKMTTAQKDLSGKIFYDRDA